MDSSRRWLPTLDIVRLVLAPALVFIVTGLDRGYQTELWQHLARGQLIAREGAVVSVDRFTFTVPGREMRDNNWLSQLLYYGLHEIGGLELVQVVNSLTLAGAVMLLVQLCRRTASGATGVAAVVGTCAFLGLWQTLLIRPQSFSMLLFVGLYVLLHAAQRRRALLCIVPPMMALWANVHGGFAIGLVLILTFAAPEPWRRLRAESTDPDARATWSYAACLFAATLATLANPYGWRVYQYAGHLSALGVARGIEEWLPPSLNSLVGCAFVGSILVVAGLAAVSWRRLTLRDVCILGCFIVPACFSVRMTVWWFLAASPVVARLASERFRGSVSERPEPSVLAAGVVATILAFCIGSLPWLEEVSPLLMARSPHRTESDLRAVADALPVSAPAPARVFTRMEWANYLAWRFEGRAPVFVEGHVELYPAETWDQFVTVNDARPGWEAVLDQHSVRFLLLDQTYHGPLLSEVQRSERWMQRARAGAAILFERRGARPGADVAGTDALGRTEDGVATDF